MKELLNKINLGKWEDYIDRIPNKSINMILTDIPYGEINRDDNGLRNLNKNEADIVDFKISDFIESCVRVCKGSIYIFCGTEQISEIRYRLVLSGFSTRLIIWEKKNPSPMNGEHIWLSGIETCVFGKLSGASFNERCKNSVLRFNSGKNKIHDTQKPLDLFSYLIRVSSNPQDIVADFCSGSGTTAHACIELNRQFICFEKEERYYYPSIERIKPLLEQGRLF